MDNPRSVRAHIRTDKNGCITQFYERLSKKKGFPNAAVAAASKPLKIVYWVMKERRGYQPRPTPSPSSSSPRDLHSTS